ncbi:MAG TPA: SpoIID/LytB domain-containing protein, partial [Actinomycetota bacterium]|nr:SpoIID/LytB domain-containing protein [Actinomycetota bacterium]
MRSARRSAAIATILSWIVAFAPVPARAGDHKLGAAVAPVRLIARGQPTLVGDHRYFGTVEIGSLSSGLTVSDRLSLEDYLLGLNEVPTDWPMEALRAQAIAARTYALFGLAQGRTGEGAVYGYDICATTACQVFSGADVVSTSSGARWRDAVSSTSHQAVLYNGAPILARYHSTSGGYTLDNEVAFPTEGAYPYLQSVSSTTETASPLYRWYVTFRIKDLEAILRRAGWWHRPAHLVSVHSFPSSPSVPYPQIAFRFERGTITRSAEDLRDVVRDLAPAMFPGVYPSRAPTSTGRLPETFPSSRVAISTRGKRVRVVGRGWGHGVGMSQWGAYGMAQQGATYTDILTHYYSGTTVGTIDEPRSIEVGLSQQNSSVTASGAFEVVDGRGNVLVRRALGTWSFTSAGPGAVAIHPPQGFGLPLRVGIVDAPKRVLVGASTFLTVALSRPAQVKTE